MHQTPWARKQSSVPSDRIRSPAKLHPPPGTGKGKGKQPLQPSPAPPKSQEVQRLETLINGLKTSSLHDRDPKGGCFCLAREHPLSNFTPICLSCGLVLCDVNLPQYTCPHCSEPLLTSIVRESITIQLDEQLVITVAKEIAEKERAMENARKAAGAFPTLSGSATPLPSPSPPPLPSSNQSHKVMSLTQKKNKVVVSSYTPKPAATALAPQQIAEEEPHRVPPPPSQVPHAKHRPDPSRPWKNLIGGGGHYIAPPVEKDEAPSNPTSRRRRNKGKEKENSHDAGSKTHS